MSDEDDGMSNEEVEDSPRSTSRMEMEEPSSTVNAAGDPTISTSGRNQTPEPQQSSITRASPEIAPSESSSESSESWDNPLSQLHKLCKPHLVQLQSPTLGTTLAAPTARSLRPASEHPSSPSSELPRSSTSNRSRVSSMGPIRESDRPTRPNNDNHRSSSHLPFPSTSGMSHAILRSSLVAVLSQSSSSGHSTRTRSPNGNQPPQASRVAYSSRSSSRESTLSPMAQSPSNTREVTQHHTASMERLGSSRHSSSTSRTQNNVSPRRSSSRHQRSRDSKSKRPPRSPANHDRRRSHSHVSRIQSTSPRRSSPRPNTSRNSRSPSIRHRQTQRNSPVSRIRVKAKPSSSSRHSSRDSPSHRRSRQTHSTSRNRQIPMRLSSPRPHNSRETTVNRQPESPSLRRRPPGPVHTSQFRHISLQRSSRMSPNSRDSTSSRPNTVHQRTPRSRRSANIQYISTRSRRPHRSRQSTWSPRSPSPPPPESEQYLLTFDIFEKTLSQFCLGLPNSRESQRSQPPKTPVCSVTFDIRVAEDPPRSPSRPNSPAGYSMSFNLVEIQMPESPQPRANATAPQSLQPSVSRPAWPLALRLKSIQMPSTSLDHPTAGQLPYTGRMGLQQNSSTSRIPPTPIPRPSPGPSSEPNDQEPSPLSPQHSAAYRARVARLAERRRLQLSDEDSQHSPTYTATATALVDGQQPTEEDFDRAIETNPPLMMYEVVAVPDSDDEQIEDDINDDNEEAKEETTQPYPQYEPAPVYEDETVGDQEEQPMDTDTESDDESDGNGPIIYDATSPYADEDDGPLLDISHRNPLLPLPPDLGPMWLNQQDEMYRLPFSDMYLPADDQLGPISPGQYIPGPLWPESPLFPLPSQLYQPQPENLTQEMEPMQPPELFWPCIPPGRSF